VSGVRWLLGSAAALVISVAISLSAGGCDACGAPPPDGCYPPAGASHQEACMSCGNYYTGCKEGSWMMIPCSATPPLGRDR
jgi:hypothetical protein